MPFKQLRIPLKQSKIQTFNFELQIDPFTQIKFTHFKKDV